MVSIVPEHRAPVLVGIFQALQVATLSGFKACFLVPWAPVLVGVSQTLQVFKVILQGRGKADGREREELAEFGDYEEELTESGDYEEELAGLYGKIIRERGKIIRERANAQGWIFY